MERNRFDLHESLEKHGGLKRKQRKVSSGYSRIFEGYTEYSVLGKDGKKHITRVYTAPYYRQDLGRKKRLAVRLGYLCALTLAAVCVISAGIQNTGSNRVLYVTLAQAACVFCMGWMAVCLVEYLPMHDNLTVYEYKTSACAIRRASFWASVSAGCLSAGSLLYMILHARECVLTDITIPVRYLLATAMVAAVCVTEHKISYETVENRNSEVQISSESRAEILEL